MMKIDQLRRIGQRDYFEFTVQRKGGATKVGAIRIELKDTNTKKESLHHQRPSRRQQLREEGSLRE